MMISIDQLRRNLRRRSGSSWCNGCIWDGRIWDGRCEWWSCWRICSSWWQNCCCSCWIKFKNYFMLLSFSFLVLTATFIRIRKWTWQVSAEWKPFPWELATGEGGKKVNECESHRKQFQFYLCNSKSKYVPQGHGITMGIVAPGVHWRKLSGFSIGNRGPTLSGMEQSGTGHALSQSDQSKNLLMLFCSQGLHGAPGLHDQHRPCESVNLNVSCWASAETTKQPTRAATVNVSLISPEHNLQHSRKSYTNNSSSFHSFLLGTLSSSACYHKTKIKTALILMVAKCCSYIRSTYLKKWKLSITTKINQDRK